MPKKNPFDYLKAKKGEKTYGEVKHDPHLTLLAREFLMDFYRWEKEHDPDLHKDDESRKRLLDLIITYKEINKINRSTRRMNKLLHKPVQGGDAKAERVMEAASKGAKDAGGITVGILPSLDKKEANEYIDIPITTGLGIGMRSELMIQTVDCIVMIGGKNGTLKELSAAYMNKKPIVIIRGSEGVADSIEKILFEGKYLDERENVNILFADSPKEAIELLVPLVSHK